MIITRESKRKQFDAIINRIDMVLMNNIAEVDQSVWANWQGNDSLGNDDCELVDRGNNQDGYSLFCTVHGVDTLEPVDSGVERCNGYSEPEEVYQWYAVNQGHAEFLQRHNQHITYSDLLDTYFLAITHFGTQWAYTSMVDDFDDCYVEGVEV